MWVGSPRAPHNATLFKDRTFKKKQVKSTAYCACNTLFFSWNQPLVTTEKSFLLL